MKRDLQIGSLVAERTRKRHELARERARSLLDALALSGFEAVIVGSLATGRFRAHSDIDILVRGHIPGVDRLKVEKIVAESLRGSGIGYDLIFREDLREARKAEFEHAHLDASGLR